MEGNAEMEMLRTLKGPSTGEVNVHLVARDSPGSSSHLPATAFIIQVGQARGLGGGAFPYLPMQVWSREGHTFTCLHTCMGQDHRAHLCHVCLCICS